MQVEREIELDAPPEEVWEALTEPERLEEWFANDVEFDAERGGTFRWDDGEVRHAVVEESEPERRLALRWWGGGEESEVTFTLVAIPTGTRLVVTETASCDWAWGLQMYAGRRRLLSAV